MFKVIPKHLEKSILLFYKDKLKSLEKWRDIINDESGKTATNLQRYSYTAGEVAAIEGVMDRLFIDYDDPILENLKE